MKLLLVDGNNVVHRCASVQKDVPRPRVIASAERMVRRAADVINATHLIVAFDAPGPSFRSAIYPEYKAHRKTDSGDRTAIALEACAAFESSGMFCVFIPSFEADDVIASLAKRVVAASPTAETHVLSSDSDLLALASERVHCWQFGRKSKTGVEEPFVVERSVAWICDKYEVPSVAALADYKALVGEPGDNIPGVRGIGPKKASAMLAGYGSLEAMNKYDALGKAGAQAVAMREIIRLRDDAPVAPVQPSACKLP